MTVKTLISEELAAFLESGLAIVVGTRDPGLQPDGAGGWAVRIHENRSTLTLYMYEQAAREMLANLERAPLIAIALDLPTSHRACQVKGEVLASRPAREDERPLIERQASLIADDLERLGIPRVLTTGWRFWPCTALEVRVTHLFEQTPGPGTGGPLQ